MDESTLLVSVARYALTTHEITKTNGGTQLSKDDGEPFYAPRRHDKPHLFEANEVFAVPVNPFADDG